MSHRIFQEGVLIPRTVGRHSCSVINKLGVQKRAELIAYAVRESIVNGNDVQQSNKDRGTT